MDHVIDYFNISVLINGDVKSITTFSGPNTVTRSEYTFLATTIYHEICFVPGKIEYIFNLFTIVHNILNFGPLIDNVSLLVI